MYCKCKEPKKKTISIMKEVVEVCAKSIGGCGNEINQEKECPVKWSRDIPFIKYISNYEVPKFDYVNELLKDEPLGTYFFDYKLNRAYIKGHNIHYDVTDYSNFIEIKP